MTDQRLDGYAAREAFLAKVRARREDGPYFVDPCHGMVGGPCVMGPTLKVGYMQGEENQRKAEDLSRNLNGAWAAGYEQALADAKARRPAEPVKEK